MDRFCYDCGETSGSFYDPTHQHLVDGEYKHLGKSICKKCAEKYTELGAFFYCFGCEDLYRADPSYQEASPSHDQMSPVLCPEHSEDSSKPMAECAVCEEVKDLYELYPTKRGLWICDDHMAQVSRCAAAYCRSYVHADMPDVVQSGSNLYCGDCAKAKTVPGPAPSGYHPLSWDYREGCNCSICQYLAGRSDLWPKPDEIPEPEVECYDCGNLLVEEVSTFVDYGPICHRCEFQHYFDCGSCLQLLHSKHTVEAVTMPYGTFWCKDCLDESPNWWFCDVSCKKYYPEDSLCKCGGVHKWNYSPDPIFQWAAKQEEVPHNQIPFLGFELEIEAHGENASRPKGAALVRSMTDDYGYLVHDGSLKGTKPNGKGGQHGFELVTHPFTYDWFLENWPRIEGMLRMLSIRGYRSWEGGRCGIHVHVSRKPMTDAHQMKFIQFIYGCTNLALCIGQRGYNDNNLDEFSPFHKEERSKLIQKVRMNKNPGIPNNKHYTAINTNKAATIEGRWFRGTLNPTSFRKNIEFMHAVWYFTKAYGFRSANEVNFVGWLNDDSQRSDYPVLREYLRREYITRR